MVRNKPISKAKVEKVRNQNELHLLPPVKAGSLSEVQRPLIHAQSYVDGLEDLWSDDCVYLYQGYFSDMKI